jgi:hypothetical protein
MNFIIILTLFLTYMIKLRSSSNLRINYHLFQKFKLLRNDKNNHLTIILKNFHTQKNVGLLLQNEIIYGFNVHEREDHGDNPDNQYDCEKALKNSYICISNTDAYNLKIFL